MKSPMESGHSLNIFEFEKFIKTLETNNDLYTPLYDYQTIEYLKKQLKAVSQANDRVNRLLTENKKNVHERFVLFKGLPKLVAKVIKTLHMMGIDTEEFQEKECYLNFLTENYKGNEKSRDKSALASQLNYGNRIDAFEVFINYLKTIPEFRVTKGIVSIENLENYLNDLRIVNVHANNSNEALSEIRLTRNTLLYLDTYGIVDSARSIRTKIIEKHGLRNTLFMALRPYIFTKSKKYLKYDSFSNIYDKSTLELLK